MPPSPAGRILRGGPRLPCPPIAGGGRILRWRAPSSLSPHCRSGNPPVAPGPVYPVSGYCTVRFLNAVTDFDPMRVLIGGRVVADNLGYGDVGPTTGSGTASAPSPSPAPRTPASSSTASPSPLPSTRSLPWPLSGAPTVWSWCVCPTSPVRTAPATAPASAP